MTTLVIHAPYREGKPGTPKSWEVYFKTGIGLGYAIPQKDITRLPTGSKVVLLRQDKNEMRAEGSLVQLVYTGENTRQGIKRYDVHFKNQKVVPFKREDGLSRQGVAVIQE